MLIKIDVERSFNFGISKRYELNLCMQNMHFSNITQFLTCWINSNILKPDYKGIVRWMG